MADLSGQTLGRYTLLARIGRGGMSSVYRASDADGGADVAIKVLILDPEEEESVVFFERFRREVEIIHNLHHLHILPLLDFDQTGEYMYFVMPLVKGGTLVELIKEALLTPQEAALWVEQIASALDYAHQLNVIHRDLKPSNVLIDIERQHAYLTDFGIAKLTNFTSNLTQTGNVIGTPAYMAPEQWRDDPLDGRTDVYGLAVMAYVMLTRRTPFESDSAHNMMYQHLNDPAPSPRAYEESIPESVAQVLLMALAKDSNDRYTSASEFALDFRRAADGDPTIAASAHEKTPPRYAPPPPPPTNIPQPVTPTEDFSTGAYGHIVPEQSSNFPYRILFGTMAAVMLIALVIGGGLLFALSNDNTNDAPSVNATEDSGDNTALDVPRIQLVAPSSPTEQQLGETTTIQFVIFDTQGVTAVALQDDAGNELERLAVESQTRYEAQFVYRPRVTGEHRLSLIAYRGEITSQPRLIVITVSEDE